jgi:hypothetical protein
VEPSLGSTFKNPPGDHAGRLIEAAGLKGKRIGGVEVSRTHANFFINPGGVGTATAADMVALIEYVQDEVETTVRGTSSARGSVGRRMVGESRFVILTQTPLEDSDVLFLK